MAVQISEKFQLNLDLTRFSEIVCAPDFYHQSQPIAGVQTTAIVETGLETSKIQIQRSVNLREVMPHQSLPLANLQMNEIRDWDFTEIGVVRGSFRLVASDLQLVVEGRLEILPLPSELSIEMHAQAISRIPIFSQQVEQAAAEFFGKLVQAELQAVLDYAN